MIIDNLADAAKWYCQKNETADLYYSIFYAVCKKYNIRWTSADNKEKAFAEEITRVTFEREMARRNGTPLSEIKPSFVA